MSYPISITDSDICTALRLFLLGILPDNTPVIRGQANRVAEPVEENFVVMTPIGRDRLETNIVTWDGEDPATIEHMQPTQITIQLDVHGPDGTDNAQRISTLFRDDYACQALNPASFLPIDWEGDGGTITWLGDDGQVIIWYGSQNVAFSIQPLYATDGHQMPFINGENQYEDRWTMNAVLQANPSISTAQQFAARLAATIYPPVGVS